MAIAVGGWGFNSNPSTEKRFSNTTSTQSNRNKFCRSLLNFMQDYGFDGADIDWEYPVAEERGGEPEDQKNYVSLISECRKVFDANGKQYGLTFTIPSSYWYLKHFSVKAMLDAGADWVNLQSYDLHGVWEKEARWQGNKMGTHSNLTEIKMSLDLLWRSEIHPADVTLGFGFYGHSYLVEDKFCTEPGCQFVDGAAPGACTNTSGILSYAEIMGLQARSDENRVRRYYIEKDAVNYMVWDTNKWVSYDDSRTFKQKIDFAKQKCLAGVMIWAIDYDTYDHQALEGLLGGNIAGALMQGGMMTADEKASIASDFNRFTGENCYVSECKSQGGGCKLGYNVLEYVHHPVRKLGLNEKECDEGDWRFICCPARAMPADCNWQGVHEQFGLCENRETSCDSEHFSLMKDNYSSKEGSTLCLPGKRDLCCRGPSLQGSQTARNGQIMLQSDIRSTIPKCRWNTCGKSGCDDGETKLTESGYGPGNNICNAHPWDRSSLCCGGADVYKNCEWVEGKNECSVEPTCPKGKITVAKKPNGWDGSKFYVCLNGGPVKFCCDAPYNEETQVPVNPNKLFENPGSKDVSWEFDEYPEENSADRQHSNEPGDDAFGLVLLDGEEDSFQGEFDNAWVFLEPETDGDAWELKKRSWAEQRTLKVRDDTFDNEVEHFRVFCPHGMESALCKAIFKGRATDTIIRMPPGIGAGPYSRVVKFDVSKNQTLTKRALRRKRHRQEEEREDIIYDLVVDYDFASMNAADKGSVQFRVDFSNLVEYWDEITAAPPEELRLRKKWFGKFKQWLSKVTDVEKQDEGSLGLRLYRQWNLFHFEDECRRGNSITKVHADLDLTMDMARYAYYFHGHILPTPKSDEAYGYFGIQPVGNCRIRLSAEGSFQSTSGEKPIISGIAFPGLSVKGLVRIGPQLDINGRVDTYLRMSGSVELGVLVEFDPVEMYFPQNAEGKAESKLPKRLPGNRVHDSIAKPKFNARAEAEGQLAVTLTPMAHFGVDVLGGKLMRGDLSLGLRNTLTLGVSASGWTGTDGTGAEVCVWADYNYDLFARGDLEILSGTYDWGGEFSLASNDEPLVIKERTCAPFGDAPDDETSANPAAALKAFLSNSAAFNTAAQRGSMFPASFGCELYDDDKSTEDNPCWGPNNEDSNNGAVSKRTPQSPGDPEDPPAPACPRRPSIFYNCFWFSAYTWTVTSTGTSVQVTFPGICDNVSDGIRARRTRNGWSEARMKARLHYKYDRSNLNRDAACGTTSLKGSKSSECSLKNREYWSNPDALVRNIDYDHGEQTYSSCDEFPFNGSLEGGAGASMKCVPQYQQDMQGSIMALLSHFTETREVNGQTKAENWKDADGPTYPPYDLHLWYNTGGLISGPFDFGRISELNSDLIVGGYNLWGNDQITAARTGNNGVCMRRATFQRIPARGFGGLRVTGCQIRFTNADNGADRKRNIGGGDPMDDPNNWGMEIVSMDDEELPIDLSALDEIFNISAPDSAV